MKTLKFGSYQFTVGEVVIANAGPRYGAAYRLEDIQGRTLCLRHERTGERLQLPAHDCDMPAAAVHA